MQAYHHTGVTWADEATPHHRTLAEAREYIQRRVSLLKVFQFADLAGFRWDDAGTDEIARMVGLID